MGKPSSSQLSRNSSTHSIKATMGKDKRNVKITKKHHLKKHHLKTQQSIQKLFNQLRDTSKAGECSRNSSQISMDSSSIIDLEDPNTTIIPRDLKPITETSIVIADDEQNVGFSPKFSLHTSTPKRGSKQDVTITQSNNNSQHSVDRNMLQTIDLTGFNNSSRVEPTVINLVDTTDDVALVSVSNASSMSGDSEVTVLRKPVSKKLRKFTHEIKNLNPAEKGKLLELITQTIFNGCNVPENVQSTIPNLQKELPRVPDTADDTYIKEIILGIKPSRNSVGSNVYRPRQANGPARVGKRMVVVDGSNVAMEHSRGKFFSVRGLQICIDYFLRRGHVVKAFVPRFRCKHGMSSDPHLLDYLERKGLVIYTPSRQVKGRLITPYDDRYIIQCAAEFDGVVVTGDNYRDLVLENPRWRVVIENRLLPFTWVDDLIMFPRDPLGRNGPTLEAFLTH